MVLEALAGLGSGVNSNRRHESSSCGPEPKTRIVLIAWSRETSIAEGVRREKVSEPSIDRCKADFLEASETVLVAAKSGPSTRGQQLEAEVAELAGPWVRRRLSCAGAPPMNLIRRRPGGCLLAS